MKTKHKFIFVLILSITFLFLPFLSIYAEREEENEHDFKESESYEIENENEYEYEYEPEETEVIPIKTEPTEVTPPRETILIEPEPKIQSQPVQEKINQPPVMIEKIQTINQIITKTVVPPLVIKDDNQNGIVDSIEQIYHNIK